MMSMNNLFWRKTFEKRLSSLTTSQEQPSNNKKPLQSPSTQIIQPSLAHRIIRFPITWIIGSFMAFGLILVLFVAAASLNPSLYDTLRGVGAKMGFVTSNERLIGTAETLFVQGKENQTASGPLVVHPNNPRYFADSNGGLVYLTGSHTWCNFMDCGDVDPPPAFDYTAYLDFLEANNHNFFRLWRAENARGGEQGDNFWFDPMPYLRPGPGVGLDGKPKFDLTQFNQAYFDRMRSRIIAAGERDIYVSIMLFDGWSVESKLPDHNPWLGHPYNASNNINGINGDLNGDGQGQETHTLQNSAVLALQEAYVSKVIDTVNDLDNVLYEICNEGGVNEWQYHMIAFIRDYQANKPQQHPIGMTVAGDDADVFASDADWVSPRNSWSLDPPPADGGKVILSDTDHICGLCGDRQWVWKSFTMGENPIYMDPYDAVQYGRGAPTDYDPNNLNDVSLRLNMGHTLAYANRINLAAMTPHGNLCSTQYCLANPAATGAEYLVYLPVGSTVAALLEQAGVDRRPSLYLPTDSATTVNLTSTPGELIVEWFNPETGTVIDGGTVAGGAVRSFTAPFSGDAVLYLYQSTEDNTPPQISQITAVSLDTVAQISWTTDEPATSQVAYRRTDEVDISTTKLTDLTTSHTVTLTGLTPESLYYFEVRSEDGNGNQAVSDTSTFTTLAVEKVDHIYLPSIMRLTSTVAQAQLRCHHNQ